MPTTKRPPPVPVSSNAFSSKTGTPTTEAHRFLMGMQAAVEDAQRVADTAAGTTQSSFMTFLIEIADNKDYRVLVNAPFGFSITSVTTRSATGTCTLATKINATALGGTANSVSTSEQTQAHTTANTVAAGDDVVLTVSSNSGAEDVSVTLACSLTLGGV